jgi:carboxyl-terminal processing protease
MEKFIRRNTRILFVGTLLFFLFVSSCFSQDLNKVMEKYRAALATVSLAYVDSVNEEKLVENAIVGMLKELDPHSVYISKDELKEMNEPLVGNFEGVGIQFQILNDTIMVVAAIPGGPSEKLGIQAGDKIIKIEKDIVAGVGVKNSDVMTRLRGDKGTKVKVFISRGGSDKLVEYVITRDKIPIYSVDAAYMATPEIGYIKINRFAQNTMDEFYSSMKELQAKGLQHLILDLRGNGGGYLHVAIALADEFLPDKKMIVYTQGLRQPKVESFSTSNGSFIKGKVVILIDEFSASASEIVSGAVQDWDRGLIIGRRSFGKGLVQKPFPLPDGSAMRLTTARYYTPTGRSIQKPYENGTDAYNKDLTNRFNHLEHIHVDSIKLPDSLKYFTPSGRTVYGGGGIMPDIFIPVDTSFSSEFYTEILRKNLLNQFVLSYLDKNRKDFSSRYPNIDAFKANFNVDETLYDEFFALAKKEGIDPSQYAVEKSSEMIKNQIKALFARNLWKTGSYYEITNEYNEAFKKAISVIQDDSFEKMKLNYNGKIK